MAAIGIQFGYELLDCLKGCELFIANSYVCVRTTSQTVNSLSTYASLNSIRHILTWRSDRHILKHLLICFGTYL